MTRRRKFTIVIVVGFLALVIWWAFPVSFLATPRWKVVVVDAKGEPLEGMTVVEHWENYSLPDDGQEAQLQTGANGEVIFPIQFSQYSVPLQIFATLGQLAQLNVHNSYGPHVYVDAYGKGLRGSATSSGLITDWTGFPPWMSSKIVATREGY